MPRITSPACSAGSCGPGLSTSTPLSAPEVAAELRIERGEVEAVPAEGVHQQHRLLAVAWRRRSRGERHASKVVGTPGIFRLRLRPDHLRADLRGDAGHGDPRICPVPYEHVVGDAWRHRNHRVLAIAHVTDAYRHLGVELGQLAPRIDQARVAAGARSRFPSRTSRSPAFNPASAAAHPVSPGDAHAGLRVRRQQYAEHGFYARSLLLVGHDHRRHTGCMVLAAGSAKCFAARSSSRARSSSFAARASAHRIARRRRPGEEPAAQARAKAFHGSVHGVLAVERVNRCSPASRRSVRRWS